MDAVLDKAVEVFGSSDKAYHWLLTPNDITNGLAPFYLLDIPEGRVTVLAILTRIEHGVFS